MTVQAAKPQHMALELSLTCSGVKWSGIGPQVVTGDRCCEKLSQMARDVCRKRTNVAVAELSNYKMQTNLWRLFASTPY